MILSLANFSAISLLWLLALLTAIKLAGTAILTFSLVFYLRYHALLRSPGSIVAFALSNEMGLHACNTTWRTDRLYATRRQLCCTLSDYVESEAIRQISLAQRSDFGR